MPEPDPYFANLQRGAQLVALNRPAEAVPFFQAAIAASPNHPEGYAGLAHCWSAIPSQRAKSIGAIDRAIALDPGNSRYFGLKGWCHICLKQPGPAWRAAQQGLALNPVCHASLNALANAYTKFQNWKQAEATCLRILELDPHDGPALNLLAQALRHQRRWKENREAVARLLATLPNNAFGHANAGFGALATGDHLRANEHFLESLRLDPHFELARKGLIESIWARVWFFNLVRFFAYGSNRARGLGLAGFIIAGLVASPLGTDALNTIWPGAGDVATWVILGGIGAFFCFALLLAFLGNFFLMFDPVGKFALTEREKDTSTLSGFFLVALFFLVLYAGGLWGAVGLLVLLTLVALSIQYSLLKDRWLRRRESQLVG